MHISTVIVLYRYVSIYVYLYYLLFSREEFYQGMEYLREKCRHRAAVCIQSVVRAFLAVKHWPELKVSLQRAKRQRDGTAVNQDSDMPPYDVSLELDFDF